MGALSSLKFLKASGETANQRDRLGGLRSECNSKSVTFYQQTSQVYDSRRALKGRVALIPQSFKVMSVLDGKSPALRPGATKRF